MRSTRTGLNKEPKNVGLLVEGSGSIVSRQANGFHRQQFTHSLDDGLGRHSLG